MRGRPPSSQSKGAVLTSLKRLCHATLYAHTKTEPTTLKDEQEIYYIYDGKGTISAGGKSADLYDGICVLMPPGLELTMTNTGDTPLLMYIMVEPVPEGAKTWKDMMVKDENVITPTSSNVHWSHIYKSLFGRGDGLYNAFRTGTGLVRPDDHGTAPQPWRRCRRNLVRPERGYYYSPRETDTKAAPRYGLQDSIGR